MDQPPQQGHVHRGPRCCKSHPTSLDGDTPSPPHRHPPGPILLPQEVLNHVLGDLDLFVVRLKTALGLASTTNLKKKKKKKGGEGQLCPGVGGHRGGDLRVSCRCQPPALCPSSSALRQRVHGLLPEGEIRPQPRGRSRWVGCDPMAGGCPWHFPAQLLLPGWGAVRSRGGGGCGGMGEGLPGDTLSPLHTGKDPPAHAGTQPP